MMRPHFPPMSSGRKAPLFFKPKKSVTGLSACLPAALAGVVFMTWPAAGQQASAPPVIAPEIVSTIVNGNGDTGQQPAAPLQKLEDVLRYTYAHNPSLLAAREGMKAVQEKMPQALAGWKPVISARSGVMSSHLDGSATGSGTTSKEIEASVIQPLYRGGRTVASSNSALNAIMAQRALLQAREQDVLLAAATAYVDVFRDTGLLSLRENNRSVLGEQMKATQARFDAGELTRADLAQSRARLAGAEADYTAAEGNLQRSRAVFERVTGLPADNTGKVSLNLPLPQTQEEAFAVAEKLNPEVIAARFFHRASQEDIDVVFGELLPSVDLFGSWNRQYDPQPGQLDDVTTARVGIDAVVPIYDAGLSRSRVREAKHTANQRYLEILDASQRVHQEVVANWESLRAARSEIEARRSQSEAASIANESVHKEAEFGTRTILDALDAEQEYLDARVALTTAERNETVALLTLAATLGALTPDVLGFPELKTDFDAQLDDIMWKIFGTDVDIAGSGK